MERISANELTTKHERIDHNGRVTPNWSNRLFNPRNVNLYFQSMQEKINYYLRILKDGTNDEKLWHEAETQLPLLIQETKNKNGK